VTEDKSRLLSVRVSCGLRKMFI